MRERWSFVVLSCYVITCALCIELMNVGAGWPLPRNGNSKWRIAAERFDKDGAPELFEEKRREKISEASDSAYSRRKRWESTLRFTVSTFGLFQYVV